MSNTSYFFTFPTCSRDPRIDCSAQTEFKANPLVKTLLSQFKTYGLCPKLFHIILLGFLGGRVEISISFNRQSERSSVDSNLSSISLLNWRKINRLKFDKLNIEINF